MVSLALLDFPADCFVPGPGAHRRAWVRVLCIYVYGSVSAFGVD